MIAISSMFSITLLILLAERALKPLISDHHSGDDPEGCTQNQMQDRSSRTQKITLLLQHAMALPGDSDQKRSISSAHLQRNFLQHLHCTFSTNRDYDIAQSLGVEARLAICEIVLRSQSQ